ncbi:PadR family transcriptional regulator [Paenibacillus senegalensis]|uniref:PadR family transcriptional regulator n=1 Tax=Paenibacillus senegalensis TaxID=1465766 RepID=UPI0006935FA8|nr:PadR family transcriptional regulator [Paenibacillus senegalensis]
MRHYYRNSAHDGESKPFHRHRHGGRRGSGSYGRGGKRYFGRGGVKFALLELLTKEPMHGYQMMKGLEEQSGGLYSPSAGSIYPTLQMLEDQDYVISQEAEGKKIYSITDLGRSFLEKGKPSKAERGWFGEWQEFDPAIGAEQIQEQRAEMAEIIRLLARAEKQALRDPGAGQQGRFQSLLSELRKRLEDYHEEE